MDEIRQYCRERFEMLDRRLNEKSHLLDKTCTDIEVLKTDFAHLTRSINALIKALWSVAGGMLAALFSFFMWYIQNL